MKYTNLKAILFICVFVAMVIFISPQTDAQEPLSERETFTGTWVNAENVEEEEKRQRAIKKLTNDMPGIMRRIAKKRLDERTTPPKEIGIKVVEDRVEFMLDNNTISLQFGAKPITVKRNGNQGKVSARFDDGKIVVTSVGNNGKRTTTYTLSEDMETLTRSLHMKGDRLPRALVCQATYRQKPDTAKQDAPKQSANGEE